MRALASKIVGSDSSPLVTRRRNWFFFVLFAVVFVVVASQGCDKGVKPPVHSLKDLNKPRLVVGGEEGTLSFRRAQEAFPLAEVRPFADGDELLVALKEGSIDAVAYDRPYLDYYAAVDPDYFVLPDFVGKGFISVGAPQSQRELMKRVNEFIEIYRSELSYDEMCNNWNGAFKPVESSSPSAYQDMYERWFKAYGTRLPVIPEPENPINPGRPYVIGVATDNAPAGFQDEDGDASGFEIEFVKRLALFLNAEVTIISDEYDNLFPELMDEKLDLALGMLDRTPDRESLVLFSESYIDSPAAVMILQNRYSYEPVASVSYAGAGAALTVEDMTFVQRMKRSFEKTFIVDNRWKLFVDGLTNTIYITVVATVLGTLMAFVQCYMRRSKRTWLRYPAQIYIAIMQGTPILVILLVLYYVVFTRLKISGELVAAIALGLNFAAYAGEQMRTGVDGIDKGLLEAARALGFGRFDVFRKVIFPIACRRIMPVYKGEFISLLKSTSIVGYVAIQDLTKASDIVRGRTYEAFFPLIATALIYLITAHMLASGFAYLEYRLNPVTRRRRAKGEVSV